MFLQETKCSCRFAGLGVGLFREYGLLITLCFNSFLKRNFFLKINKLDNISYSIGMDFLELRFFLEII